MLNNILKMGDKAWNEALYISPNFNALLSPIGIRLLRQP
jgi:hypothetical protein